MTSNPHLLTLTPYPHNPFSQTLTLTPNPYSFRLGLDSFQAKSVTDALKTLTSNGRIVVTVIHQPRSSIFELFDDLLLLSGYCLHIYICICI
jgi:hypothetical protein